MTDPVYGDNPLDPAAQWDQTIPPPMATSATWQTWRDVWDAALLEVAESQWLTRWRRAVTTAEGEQLRVHGEQLVYPQPSGWADARYRAVLVALYPASLGHPTSAIVYALADALLDTGQTVVMKEEYPCSARFEFTSTDSEEAVAYYFALERARPRGCQYFVVAHPGGGASPFTVGTSTVDGLDTLALGYTP